MQSRLQGRHVLAAAIGSVASLAAAAPALAGTFTVNHADATAAYQAQPGEANSVSLISQAKLKLQDKGVPSVGFVELGGGSCLLNEPYKYECPNSSVASATIALGDGSDTYTDVGTSIDTVVRGGAGAKTVRTGAGDDRVLLRNGAADVIVCGTGQDSVVADADDLVAADCEVTDFAAPVTDDGGSTDDPVPGTTGGSDGSTGGDTGEDAAPSGDAGAPAGDALETALGLTLPMESVSLPRPDVAIVPLACAETELDGCRGEVILNAAKPKAAGARASRVSAARGRHVRQQRRRNRRLGRRSFQLDAGESVKLPITIALRGHHALVSRRRRRPKAILRVVHRDAAGKVIGTQTRTVRLERKWSRKRGSR